MDENIPYEKHRNPNLPWGYWMAAPGETTGDQVLIDEDDSRWASVRECLWVKRFNMAMPEHLPYIDLELEFLLTFLVITERRIIRVEEKAIDIFGDHDRARFYQSWLIDKKLMTYDRGGCLFPELTPEAFAILLMLANTRSLRNQPLPVGLPTLERWHGLDPEAMTPEWEAALQKLERYADRLPYRFERVMIGKLHAIRLVGDGLGPNIPLRRTLWSLSFPDQYARDRFYFWLCHRVDRWSDWGTRAWENGPRALSEYRLQLKFCDESIDLTA